MEKLSRSTLLPEVVEKIGEILAQDAESLNSEDVAFLRARVQYLSKSERERFASVLKVEAPKAKELKAPVAPKK